MATINFNAENVAPSVALEALPAGKYNVVITDSDIKTNRRGDGEYLQFEFEVIDGDYRSRKLWSRLNTNNPNPDAVRMANADLSAICHAVGVLQPRDTVELHNLPLVVTVRCRKTPDGVIVNDIKSYEAVARPVAPASQTVVQSGGSAPWAKR
jgi:hypothetical protein